MSDNPEALKSLADQARVASVMDDPGAEQIAKTYAVSFLDAAESKGSPESLETLTSFVDDVLTPNPEFERILTSPLTGTDNQLGMLDRVAGGADPLTKNFLSVLARHGRLDLLRNVLEEAWRERETREGKKRVTVRTAAPLSESDLAKITDRIKTAVDFEPVVIPETDPDLIGGLVIQVGDTVYDSSLRTRLKGLRGRLKEAFAHEIQSGRDRFSSPEGD